MHLNTEQGHEKGMHWKVNASYDLETYAMMGELASRILLGCFCTPCVFTLLIPLLDF